MKVSPTVSQSVPITKLASRRRAVWVMGDRRQGQQMRGRGARAFPQTISIQFLASEGSLQCRNPGDKEHLVARQYSHPSSGGGGGGGGEMVRVSRREVSRRNKDL